MSVDAMEFTVIVLCGILIVSVIYEMTRYYMKRVEDKREQERADHWRRRQDR